MIYDFKDKKIVYVENIPVGKRIRDIISLDNGKIVLLTDVSMDDKPEIILITKTVR